MELSLVFVIILGFVGFVTSFGAHIVAVNLPIYAQQIGAGLAMIGILIAAYDLAELIAKPIFGTLSDKTGMKKTMMAGIIIFTVASFSFLFIDPRLLVFVRFVQGIGAAALSAVSLALVGIYYKRSNRGRAYGIYNTIKGAGYVVAPVLGGFIVAKNNFSSIFIVVTIIGVLSFLFSLFLPNTKEKTNMDEDDDFSPKSFLAVFKQPTLLPWFIVTVVNMFFVGILFGFLPVRIHDLGYNPFQSGLILSIVTLSYLFIQPIAGYYADKINPAITIRLGLFLAGISVIFFPFVNGILLVLFCILAGIGVGTVWTNTDVLVSNLAKNGKMGATMGAVGSFKEFGDMVGPLLIGILSQTFGLTIGFVICGALGLLSLLLITKKT